MSRALTLWSILLATGLGHVPLADARVAGNTRRGPQGAGVRAPDRAVSSGLPTTAPASLIEGPLEGPEEAGVGRRAPQLLNTVEMLSLAKRYSNDIADSLIDGERRREEAVRRRDVIKLACIQDRLSSMKMMKKLSDDRLASTERPLVRSDELSLRHEFRGVEMAHERMLQLQRELIECVGENLELAQSAENGQAGGTLPSGAVDPAGSGIEPTPSERPAPASPFR